MCTYSGSLLQYRHLGRGHSWRCPTLFCVFWWTMNYVVILWPAALEEADHSVFQLMLLTNFCWMWAGRAAHQPYEGPLSLSLVMEMSRTVYCASGVELSCCDTLSLCKEKKRCDVRWCSLMYRSTGKQARLRCVDGTVTLNRALLLWLESWESSQRHQRCGPFRSATSCTRLKHRQVHCEHSLNYFLCDSKVTIWESVLLKWFPSLYQQ